MKDKKAPYKQKNSYSKPQLRRIELKADEILAVGCKSSSGGFNLGSAPPCNVGTCSGLGS